MSSHESSSGPILWSVSARAGEGGPAPTSRNSTTPRMTQRLDTLGFVDEAPASSQAATCPGAADTVRGVWMGPGERHLKSKDHLRARVRATELAKESRRRQL